MSVMAPELGAAAGALAPRQGSGVYLAVGVLLIWLAFVGLFVAFEGVGFLGLASGGKLTPGTWPQAIQTAVQHKLTQE